MKFSTLPTKQGLYDPNFEHDACGIGFVVNIKGRPSRKIIDDSIQVLERLNHRGATGAEANSGDGAGILIQIPHQALRMLTQRSTINLPASNDFGVGMFFLPTHSAVRKKIQFLIEEIVSEYDQESLGWREVNTNKSLLGETARKATPYIAQLFIGAGGSITDTQDFERTLYVIRKIIENRVSLTFPQYKAQFYIPSISCRTLVYKGMLTTPQLKNFYPELLHPAMESAIGLVHSRFSTNTFPSWDRAHPYRYLMHNGEINTVQGNENWMKAREMIMDSKLFGDKISKILPIIDREGSDSGKLDNILELLVLGGRSLAHAFMMLVPEPWTNHESMSKEKKSFYEYHACLMETWDGPASIAFTDGIQVGAILDRNGLRPSRYYVTKDDRLILASEVGVLELSPEIIQQKERLRPGRMLLVDTRKGRIIDDNELKDEITSKKDYSIWINQNLVDIKNIVSQNGKKEIKTDNLVQLQQVFGYTFEELRFVIEPMTKNSIEGIGSMGNDTPLAVLSERPKLLYNYFKQLFAQVTNPPIDAIREEVVTSTITTLGREGNLLEETPQSCRQIRLETPILSIDELERIRSVHEKLPEHKSVTLSILFEVQKQGEGIKIALNNLFSRADEAIKNNASIIILSDRGINSTYAAIPALLAVSALHHNLVKNGTRTKVGLVVESGEPREVHHMATLIGYGAGAVCPYLAYESIHSAIETNLFGTSHKSKESIKDYTAKAINNYRKALLKGIIKVLSKMGISTIQAYRGAQIFEAVGISSSVIDLYFCGTASRLEGIDIEGIANETLSRHKKIFDVRKLDAQNLDVGGEYQWREVGEYHLNNPKTIHTLQEACRKGNFAKFREYSQLIDNQHKKLATLRGLLDFKHLNSSIPLNDVEPVTQIMKRFKTGAMSYGSVSSEAHETLAIAMNRIGGKSNTGEGGEDPLRFTPDENGDLRNSAIKQVASGRFGVTSHYLVNADEIQIKMAQGAKPGEGGQLPGTKVYPWIAEVRHSTPGVGLISPPPHHDIYSIEDLAELIHDLKNANTKARINVKLVSEIGVGTIAAGVAKAHADVVLISGSEGGTGASPLSSVKHAGLPWELGIAETHQTLLLNDLRSRIVVETDGQLKTGRDIAIAALLGAEEFGFATAPIIAMGCIMMRVCHLNTCPVGIATQDPELREKFTGDPNHVVNFMKFVAEELRLIMAELGFKNLNDMIGRVEFLEPRKAVDHWKAKGVDLKPLLYKPEVSSKVGTYCNISQNHRIDEALDRTTLWDLVFPKLEKDEPINEICKINNSNRVVGTIIGSEVTKRYGADGLPEDRIQLVFNGSAGQSFGAFIPPGITLNLNGDANDYVGKGLSGGKIIVKPPPNSTFSPENNIIIGNVAFYGATRGQAFINGIAGERFCVRNSGIEAVVEGIGDHGCEYMTGGYVLILGETGRNFGAGMSGGIAYIYDPDSSFQERCNTQMVDVLSVESDSDLKKIKELTTSHLNYTKSNIAKLILMNWKEVSSSFIKVYPRDFRRMQQAIKRVNQQGLTGEEAIMSAFLENANNQARITGN